MWPPSLPYLMKFSCRSSLPSGESPILHGPLLAHKMLPGDGPAHPLGLCLPPLTRLLHCVVCCPTPRVFLGPEIPAWNLCSNLPGTVSESWIFPQATYNSSSPIPPPLQPHSLKIYLLFRMAHTPPPPGSLAWLQARLKASLLFSQHPLYTLCYLCTCYYSLLIGS